MALELKMPALSPTMEKGTLARWLVGEGDLVRPGDLIAEIETDKATMEFEAVDEGRVSKLLVAEGTDDVPVGTVIMLLTGEGEGVAAPQPVPAVLTPAPKILLPEPTIEAARTNATPLARRIASISGIALPGVGSGPRGRVVKADLGLRSRMPVAVQAMAPPVPAAAAPPVGVPVETVKLSTMRKTIARRLAESKASVPHFYLTVRCNIDRLLALRAQLNAGLTARGIKLSVNDMLLKAMALALVEVPDANVQFGGDELHRFGRVDLSMAVAIDGGLVTPVIRDVGGLSLSSIAQVSRSLAERARAGKLLPEDYEGGTASISNLGMFGIDEMVPVINPPQALILGIGAAIEQPWKVDGAIGLATIMAGTASFDHRAIDGAIAARFIAAFRDLVETPLSICC